MSQCRISDQLSGGECVELRPPAKLNLILKVLGRRGDGYHYLHSLLAPIELRDYLRIQLCPELNGEVEFSCKLSADLARHVENFREVEAELSTSDNLVVRAARACLSGLTYPPGVKIHLEKCIPFEAGLGGGSSDAAQVLVALSKMMVAYDPECRGCAPKDLIGVAASLGSDVPAMLFQDLIFIHGTGSEIVKFGGGALERFRRELRSLGLLVLKPKVGVCTSEAYQRLGHLGFECSFEDFAEAGHGSYCSRWRELLGKEVSNWSLGAEDDGEAWLLGSLGEGECVRLLDLCENLTRLGQHDTCESASFLPEQRHNRFFNDFEGIAWDSSWDSGKELRDAREALLAVGASHVMLAGSGSACVGLFPGQKAAEFALRSLSVPDNWFRGVSGFLV